jgi:dihydrodipicolinate synthase/N-acetylneuraminate lyase
MGISRTEAGASYIQIGHMVLIWVIVTALGSVGQFETLTEDNILETEQMARFHVELGNGEKIVIEAEAVDNVPEFVRELKEHGYVTGRKEGGEAVALIDPHVAVVRLMRAD